MAAIRSSDIVIAHVTFLPASACKGFRRSTPGVGRGDYKKRAKGIAIERRVLRLKNTVHDKYSTYPLERCLWVKGQSQGGQSRSASPLGNRSIDE